jgi:hypothetical protein
MAMTNTTNLRRLAGERFVQLLLGRAPTDQRTTEQLRQAAAREVVKEARRAERLTAPTHERPTPSNAFEVLFAKIWRTVQNARQFDKLMARKKAPDNVKSFMPTIDANPVIVSEPQTNNVVAFPPDAPLVRANFSSAKLIDDAEFPSRYHDQTTSNWRASIQQNESISKLRAERSAQLRSQQPKYVG